MSAGMYDAIVVGARCAGSPTAMLLARKGYRVLLVDKATFPSDTMSTHLVHPPGVAALERWGLLDRLVATGCPPVERYSFDFGPVTIAGSPQPVDGVARAYCPRRTVLDQLLVDAAVEAGAELREGFTVDEVLAADGDGDGDPRPREGRPAETSPRPDRDRRRRPPLRRGPDGPAGAVQRAAVAAGDVLRVLERAARRRASRPSSAPSTAAAGRPPRPTTASR